ncbi:OmpA family protein [Buchananella hordeovulneris]|uniref:OmpA family protein n=1 Tax=Buchananella hordeovulneris TaxID=52770 RepID=UPI0026DA91E7|nr:OmpA family protein [Buchananella hordeovulneris]MDO5079868.1 OmpA family protein [Buchananella hordeovulneris]
MARGVVAVAAGASLLCLGLTACSASPTATPTPAASSASAVAAPVATAVTRFQSAGGVHVSVTAGPAVRSQGMTVVPISVSSSEQTDVNLGEFWDAGFGDSGSAGLRLVDFDAGQVYLPLGAVSQDLVLDGQLLNTFAVFGPVAGEKTNLMLPVTGMLYDIPVVDGELPAAQEYLAQLKVNADRRLPVDLEVFSEDTESQLGLEVRGQEIKVQVPSDVLFDVDSAELSPEAAATLDQVAAQLSGIGGGQLTVTGHTDAVGDADYNQELSVQRAQAVYDYLATKTDAASYQATVEGRGASQPRNEGTSPEDLAANRRVELLVQGTKVEKPQVVSTGSGQMVAPVGATASGKDAIFVSRQLDRDTTARIAVRSVTKRGNYLVGELALANGPDSTVAPIDFLGTPAISSSASGALSTSFSSPANMVSLLQGQARIYPAQYREGTTVDYLTDRKLDVTMEPNRGYTVTVIWPLVDGLGDKVTVDVDGNRIGVDGWRVSDVEVN